MSGRIALYVTSNPLHINSRTALTLAKTIITAGGKLRVFFLQEGVLHILDPQNSNIENDTRGLWIEFAKENNIALEYCTRAFDIYSVKITSINSFFTDTGLTRFLDDTLEYIRVEL